MTNLVGQQLGQYRITSLLGEGGMAAVYRARQETVKRDVAIKVIKTNLVDVEDFSKRFEREAQTVAALSHAHIVKIFDYGRQDNTLYIVMELLTGGSVASVINRGPMDPKLVSRILDQVASALDYAHRKGVIHRDLKPENILLDESGNSFLSDFGLAKMLNQGMTLTETGVAMGTPSYMPPEQWQSKPLDGRADQYALGVMIYEMLSGIVPLKGDSVLSTMYLHIHEPPPPIQTHRPDLPYTVDDVLQKALAKVPDQRYQSVGEFAAAFKNAFVQKTAPPKPESMILVVDEDPPVADEKPASVVTPPAAAAKPASIVSPPPGMAKPASMVTPPPGAAKPPSMVTPPLEKKPTQSVRPTAEVPPASPSTAKARGGFNLINASLVGLLLVGVATLAAIGVKALQGSTVAVSPTAVRTLPSFLSTVNLDTPVAMTFAAQSTLTAQSIQNTMTIQAIQSTTTAQAIASFTKTPTTTATLTGTPTPSPTSTATRTPTRTRTPSPSPTRTIVITPFRPPPTLTRPPTLRPPPTPLPGQPPPGGGQPPPPPPGK